MHGIEVQNALGAVHLGVNASNQLVVVQYGQHVITVFAFRLRSINFNFVIKVPKLNVTHAVTHQIIKGRKQDSAPVKIAFHFFGEWNIGAVNIPIPFPRRMLVGNFNALDIARAFEFAETFVQIGIATAEKVLRDLFFGADAQ